MVTVSNTSEADSERPAGTGPDRTKNGRPIFKTDHYNKISVKERGAIRILKVHPGAPEQTEVPCELIPGTILSDEGRLQHETSGVTTYKLEPSMGLGGGRILKRDLSLTYAISYRAQGGVVFAFSVSRLYINPES
jgi:hypothetical protein